MVADMPILDDRTDVLKGMVTHPIKPAEQNVVIRELANVVISMSGDVFTVMRIVRGENGNDDGLLGEVRRVRESVADVLAALDEMRKATQKAEADAKDAKQHSKFSDLLNWLVDKVLPTLVTAAILAAAAFTVGVWLHLKIVSATP